MIAEYLRDLEAALRRLPPDERDAVLEEVGAHLRQQAQDLQGQGMTPAEAEAEAVARFGTAEEIASGYDEASGTVRRPTGEVVLEVTRKVGRGAGKAAVGVGRVAGKGFAGLFKFVGAVVITALIVAGVIATAAIVFADDWAPYIQDAIEDSIDHELYSMSFNQNARNETFYVPEADTVSISWYAWGPASACTEVRAFAPDGGLAYQTQVCNDENGRTTLPPVSGQWRIEVDAGGPAKGYLRVTYRAPDDP